MIKKVLLVSFAIMFAVMLLSVGTVIAWTNCPPAELPANPQVVTGQTQCIVQSDWSQLGLNEAWSREVKLESGQSYWFSASKCARAYSVAGEVRDDQGRVLKSDSGSSVGFCFRPPKTGTYKVSYRVTGLNSSYSYAITTACLAKSNCKP